MSSDLQRQYYPETEFGGYTHVDGTVEFYTRINALLEPWHTVLDVGCGRGAYQDDGVGYRKRLRILRGKCEKVIGLDVDPAARANPHVDEVRLLQDPSTPWPVEDNSIDLCLCDYVMEHVQDPDLIFQEFHRVLRPNGILAIRTPNLQSYFGLASRLLSFEGHTRLLPKLQRDRRDEDVFPTLYRCNTAASMKRFLRRYNFDYVICPYGAEPQYAHFSRLLYWLLVQHQRYAPRPLKINLFVFARKAVD